MSEALVRYIKDVLGVKSVVLPTQAIELSAQPRAGAVTSNSCAPSSVGSAQPRAGTVPSSVGATQAKVRSAESNVGAIESSDRAGQASLETSANKWRQGGELLNGMVVARPLQESSLFESELGVLYDRMIKGMKLEPSQVWTVELKPHDIDKLFSVAEQQGAKLVVLMGEEFEPYVSMPRGQIKSVSGVSVLRTLDPEILLTREDLKRGVWDDLKQALKHLGAQL